MNEITMCGRGSTEQLVTNDQGTGNDNRSLNKALYQATGVNNTTITGNKSQQHYHSK